MNPRLLLIGLLGLVLFYLVFSGACFLVMLLVPGRGIGKRAAAALGWLPPFLAGDALREWAAATAERLARQQLSRERTGDTASQLAADVETGATRAMLPRHDESDLWRIIACPEVGQGLVGVTAPEVLSIATHIRKELPHSEQERVYAIASANAARLEPRTRGERAGVLECPLQGEAHVCCVYAARPLRCRILHAAIIANEAGERSDAARPGDERHEEIVANGVEIGLTRALDSAGLSAKVYELNSALVIALGLPDAARRWAKGEDIFAGAQALR